MHVIHKQNCSRSRPGYVAPPSERVVLFSLAVVFGKMIISLSMNITMNQLGGASLIAKFHS